jgi:hypothetical protein
MLLVEDDPLIHEFEALAWSGRRVVDVLATESSCPETSTDGRSPNAAVSMIPALPVIYATGFSPTAPRPVPGSLTLQKPYRPEDIVRAVRRVASSPA